MMDRQEDTQKDECAHMDRQIDKQTEIQRDKQMDIHRGGYTP